MARNVSSFSVQNPDALTAMFDRMDAQTAESVLRQSAASAATIFYREVKVRAMVHYRTGNLEESLLVTYVPEDSVTGKLATYMVTFNQKAWYARLIECGTSKMAARPFIRPAYEAKKQEASNAAKDKMVEAITRG
jgi:HK97 gp10 family phage protein